MTAEQWLDAAAVKIQDILATYWDCYKHPEWYKDKEEYDEALRDLQNEGEFISLAAEAVREKEERKLANAKPKLIFPLIERNKELAKNYQLN